MFEAVSSEPHTGEMGAFEKPSLFRDQLDLDINLRIGICLMVKAYYYGRWGVILQRRYCRGSVFEYCYNYWFSVFVLFLWLPMNFN